MTRRARALGGGRRVLELELPPDGEAVREEIRRVVAEVAETDDPAERRRRMVRHGLIAPHWPPPYGRDAGPVEQLVIDEEMHAAHVRRPHARRRGMGAADDRRSRHARAAGAVGRPDSRRRAHLVPALQRARGGKRPGFAVDARRARRGRVRAQRSEGLDEHRAGGRTGGSASPGPIPMLRSTPASPTSWWT